MTYKVLDLFSGIGGFSLGLERAGMETVAFCEIDPFCRKVLRKHWPNVPIYEDIRELTKETLNGITADVICGGFPCQDISNAGLRAGIAGERSRLWAEMVRLVNELRPRKVIVENVRALLVRGIDTVLGDLARSGYDAEWHCIPASAVGAPHRRDRIWIIAYPCGERGPGLVPTFRADASGPWWVRGQEIVSQPDPAGHSRWPEPIVCGMDDGLSGRMDRLRSLGNAVVPQVVEVIGRAIMA